jgi:1-acyl-sn-glycerol-3-phosphate acyltransferase
MLVLMPEGYAAVRAARANRLQSSLNLALGSALASIGLTIPTVATIAIFFNLPLSLGISNLNMTLMYLSFFIGGLTLAIGRTTMLQGVVHLIIFFEFLGQRMHQKLVHVMNFFLLNGVRILGTGLKFVEKTKLPTNRPIIFVANHQSMFDIIGMIWFLRKNFPVFVSKQELSKGIPSISYNLNKSGAALIDREDGKQAVVEIARLAKMIEENNFSACIFPEGTRSRTGTMKPFAVGGIAILMKKAPNALIVPVAIENVNKLNPKGYFPLVSFQNLIWTVLPAIERGNKTPEEVVEEARNSITKIVEVKSKS